LSFTLNNQQARQSIKMRLGLSEALLSLVKAKFEAAKASSSLLFSPSELAIIRTSTGVPVGIFLPKM
jgi:ATP adenylyltransferase